MHMGVMRMHHYGFLADRYRKAKLAQIRTALAQGVQQTPSAETDGETSCAFDGYPCPKCRVDQLCAIGFVTPLSFEKDNTKPVDPAP